MSLSEKVKGELEPNFKIVKQVVDTAIFDYLRIRLFLMDKHRLVRVACIHLYRQELSYTRHTNCEKEKQRIKTKVRTVLCNRVRKIHNELLHIRVFLSDCENNIFLGKSCKEVVDTLENLSTAEIKLLYKEYGVKGSKINLNGKIST